MKINFKKLSSDNSSSSENVTKLNTAALNSTEDEQPTSSPKPSTGLKLNLGKLSSEVSSSSENVTKLNTTALASKEADPASYDLKFTEGETYDLDEIIFAKRRDNADCPLIVKYNDDNTADAKILESIVKLILSDYGVTWDDNVTKDNPSYYTNVVYKVPDFYTIFTTYFNRYYIIYYNSINGILEGALSLSSVIETIQTSHDNVYANVLSDDYDDITAYTETDNKSKVEWDYGTLPDDGRYDFSDNSSASAVVEKFSFELTNEKLTLNYDGAPVENCEISFDELADAIFDPTNVEVDIVDDISDCEFITATDFINSKTSSLVDLRKHNEELCSVQVI